MKFRKGLLCLLLAVIIAAAGLAWLQYESNLDAVQNGLLEELRRDAGQYDAQSIVLSGTNKSAAEELAQLLGATLRITEDGSFATLTLPDGVTILDVAVDENNRRYLEQMSVDYQVQVSELEEDQERFPVSPVYSGSDDAFGQQDYLAYLNMGQVWDTYTGSGVTVAIIDTGIDTDHPEFAGRISEYSYNATEDKIVKDYNDWSLVEDEVGHGTAVAGVLAASMNNGGMVGIAPNVEIIVIKAECDESGEFLRSSDLVFGLYYAIERDVQVVNMSFGTPVNIFAEAAQLAYDSDIICVASAGNNGSSMPMYPAADENVIGVGALAQGSWELADYSNYGENTNLVAPGSTYTTTLDGGYSTTQGTSLSAPQVAGAVALFMQNNRYTTFDQVTQILYASCYDLGDLGRDWDYGFGALDVQTFLQGERGTVTFDMLTDELENQEGQFIRGVPMQEMPEPERLYAVFDGWYYDDTFTQEYEYYTDAFTGDLTLYAKWVNEDDGIPYTYVILDDGTVEIRSYTGHRRFITIPEKIEGRVVSSIGDFAFSGQTRLREVTLPGGLTHIGLSAFSGCSNLVSIHIPDGVTVIEEAAFADNVRLSTLALGSGSCLKTVGDFAFRNCGRLETLELPASITYFNGSAVYGATSLERITVRSGNVVLKSVDGVVFTADGSELVAHSAAHGNSYTIPGGCVKIGDYAFGFAQISQMELNGVQTIGKAAFANAALETLTIPDSVTELGEFAFSGNSRLSQVTLGNGITAVSVSCFSACYRLEQIYIPDGITAIDGYAFDGSGLRTVTFGENSRLTEIGAGAFIYSQLGEIDIPASVTTIGDAAFYYTPISSVTFVGDSALTEIGGSAFEKCVDLKTITLPARLQTIGDMAFASSGLEAVTVPASVTDLGLGTFAYCNALTAVTVEAGNAVYEDVDGVVYTEGRTVIHTYPAGKDLTDYTLADTTRVVESYAFAGTGKLWTVTLNEALEEIHEYGFHRSGIDSIHIPANVMQISRYSFAECWNMETATFAPDARIPRLSYGAFAYCGLTEFTVPANVSTMAQEVFIGCKDLTEVRFAQNSKLESISAYMFKGCESLESIIFESGSALTSIQAHGLEGMDKLTYIDFGDAEVTNVDNFAFRFCTSLANLTLPETVISIGRYAFYGCESLAELTVPAPVEHIGSYAFLGTNDMELYLKADTMPQYLDENWDHGIRGYYVGVTDVSTSGDFKYAVLTSGNIAILEYLGTDTTVDLTAVDLGAPITAIGGSAFEGSTVTGITLPDTLREIQAEAFLDSALESVTIPANVRFIGREAFAHTPMEKLTFAAGSQLAVMEQYAFQGTENLTAVTLPRSLTTMGTGVFQESGLTAVTFESGIGITEIPQKAFANTKLTSVVLPDSVTLVNHNAFNNVQTLKSVAFGSNEGIRLMSNAFYHTGLTSLHIPANVTYIGEYCFVALPNLTEFTVDAGNPNYQAVDGLLLNKSGRKLIAVPAGRTGSLTVPASVEEIGFGAFEESKLSQVLFREDANILSLGYRAFFKANGLTEITIPASVVSVDYYAFAYCENLHTVNFAPDNQLKGIYEGAFCGDISLKNITIPASVVEISDFAFYGCTALEEIPVDDPQALKGIYDYAFAYTGISGGVTMPENLIDIGSYAFMGTRLEKVTIPDTNKKDLIIGIGAFEGCEYMTEITLPFIGAGFEDEEISWFGYIFGAGSYDASEKYVPKSLKNLTITEGITFIGEGGFANCTGLEIINIPKSVSTLWDDAFENTSAKYELHGPIVLRGASAATASHFGKGISGKLELAKGIVAIDSHAFEQCYNLCSIVIPEGVTTIGNSAFYGATKLSNIELPDSITNIHGMAFYFCRGLTNIRLPSNLSVIEEYLFMYCSSLTSIDIPNSVVQIQKYAFYGCTGLDRISIPCGVTTICDEAFYGCTSLFDVTNSSALDIQLNSTDYGWIGYYAKILTDNDGNISYLDPEYGFEYVETPDGFRFIKENDAYKLVAYIGEEEVITLPKDINGNEYSLYYFTGGIHVIIPDGTTQIDDYAFYDNGSIRSVSIPGSVKTIGAYAFRNTTGLDSIVIPEGVEIIGREAFCSSSIQAVVFPETLHTICDSAFSACTKLKDIWIPDGVTTIAGDAFRSCFALETVRLSANLTTIPYGMFHDCENLKTVNIPKGVTTIGPGAFMLCTELEKVVLPDTIKAIKNGAFEYCESLTEFKLPDGIEELGDNAFYGCINLARLVVPDSVTSIGGAAFDPNIVVAIDEDNQNFQEMGGIIYNKPATTIIQVTGAVSDQVIIPQGITSVPNNAFRDCHEISTVILPESVTYIGEGAFQGCANLKMILIPEGVTQIANLAFAECIKLDNVEIPDSVTGIGSNAFSGCAGLQTIVLPENLRWLGSSVFSSCDSLQSIELPAGITEIPYMAFYDCGGLTEITISENVTRISDHAFAHCNRLYLVHNNSTLELTPGDENYGYAAYYAKAVVDKNGNTTYLDESADFEYIDTAEGFRFLKENGEYTLLAYMGTEEVITLPESIEGNPYSLYYFSGGKKIIIPEGITEINSFAFACNGTIEDISLPFGVTVIANEAFVNCRNLKVVDIPESVVEIGEAAFYNCSSLESVIIPESITTVGDRSFELCNSLTSIVLPDNIEYLGWRAFYESGFYNDPANWDSGVLFLDGYLVAVSENAEYINNPNVHKGTAERAYLEAKRLRKAIYDVNMSGTTNVETLVVYEPEGIILYALENRLALKNVVMTNSVKSYDLYNNPNFFYALSNVTIFVEANEKDLRWDDNFPGWNNGNLVIYGDNWIWADFYDADGTLLSSEPLRTSQIIRRPVVTDYDDGHYTYKFVGWDLDGDGQVDSIPATSAVDIKAVAVYEQTPRMYTVTFMDGDRICSQEQLPYGAIITAPADPVREGEIFEGWSGYTPGMTVAGDMTFTAKWHSHAFGEWYEVQAPTCTEDGQERRDCQGCDHHETRITEATGHEYSSVITEPNCTEQGYTTHTCINCGDEYVDSYVDAKGHSFGSWTVIKAATCTEDGQVYRTCEECGYQETRAIPKMGHNYEAVATDPTCTEQGYTTHTCANCGDEYVDSYVDAQGHKFGNWTVVKDAICTEDGQERRDCENCDHYENRTIEATGHDYKSVVTAPTCTEQGYTTHICTKCGDSYVDTHTAALGHEWGEWVVVKEPTREEAGEKQRTCERCGHTETESIPRLELVYGDVNGDGAVNVKDVVLLRQYLAGWNVDPDMDAADVNGDGRVNVKDVVLLRQYLAGWNVTLGPKIPEEPGDDGENGDRVMQHYGDMVYSVKVIKTIPIETIKPFDCVSFT